MREFAIVTRQEFPEELPWNVQVWRGIEGKRWYSGEGMFCRDEQEAREWCASRGVSIEEWR